MDFIWKGGHVPCVPSGIYALVIVKYLEIFKFLLAALTHKNDFDTLKVYITGNLETEVINTY